MKKLTCILILVAFACIANSYGQRPAIELTFTSVNDTSYFQLSNIKVKNLTQGGDTILYYPDTVLVLNYVGINEKPDLLNEFRVTQNFPNPVANRTTIGVYVPEKDKVSLTVTDVLGHRLITSERMLEKGYHTFQFEPTGEKLNFFTASWEGISKTIKILNTGSGSGRPCSLEYMGSGNNDTPLKSSPAIQEFPFSPGDELMFIGYADTLESGFLDSPETSQDYVFQFATNIPCPGVDSVYYDGQWYHTIQIFSQCWIRENMNAGIMIPSTQVQTDNDIIEKYCMGDDDYYCNIAGGLYFWDEMMKYTNEDEGQGICPEGFHVPGDLEWQILEGAADSGYEIGDPVWGINSWRGTNAGGNLKQTGTTYWVYPNTGATDAFGFTALPGGYFVQNAFWGIGYKAYFWSSHPLQKFYRNMDWNQAMIQRYTGGDGTIGFSVRCIRN
ncbi:MAG: hypothetical protein M0Q51_05705 [Bacteroidales bacterium]|nr:hypothetical protein [Bacteroidales bacterium]